nr:hypothetical protein [Nocardia abscessus]
MGNYSFLPYLRQGLANNIGTPDFDPNVEVRASVTVTLEVRGEKLDGGTATAPVRMPVAMFGPGDLVGIDRRMIVRVEPRDWITNFEPNRLAHIEFYDEDMPWRYTPAAPERGRLRPWIALIVLTEAEFTDGKNVNGRPLPYIDVANLDVFPRADEMWAWAHVHVNRSLAGTDDEFITTDMAAVIPRLQEVLAEDPDLAYSRLLCPRKLAENTAYHAFVVPVFEAGRRAGLGLDLGDVVATASAWEAPDRPEGLSFPYYHRWYFRTGTTGDFETLVRLLTPKPVDPRVGFREMDVLDPGSNVRPLDKPELGGILKLGGALQPPDKVPPEPPDKYETWDQPFPRPLQIDLAHLLNLPDTYQAGGDPDPVVAPPLYGRWYLPTQRVLQQRNGTPITPADNWIHRLNLDPRFRVAAGLGTRVIQQNQEKYMEAVWEQIGKVLEAQHRIWFGQFGVLTSLVWYEQHLVPMLTVNRQQTLMLIAPLAKRLVTDDLTIDATMRASFVQPVMMSPAMRRITRPRGRLMRSLPFDDVSHPGELIDRVNASEVNAAPPKVAPPGVPTGEEVAAGIAPKGLPAFVVDLLRRHRRLPVVVLLIAFLLALLFVLLMVWPIAVVIAVVGAILYLLLRIWENRVRAADAVPIENQTPESVDQLPKFPDFAITEHGSGSRPRPGRADSVEATRFKQALRDTFTVIRLGNQAGRVKPKLPLDLDRILGTGLEAIDPKRTIPRRVMAGIDIPRRIADDIVTSGVESFVEPMAYPVIDQPMYEPLKDISAELFLPNINLVEQNSITLLQTNQRFIESYMVGLNHEQAREQQSRGFPSDLRGSIYRQFWDVRSHFNADNLDDETFRESLRDIRPLHFWANTDALGNNGPSGQGSDNEEELVLVIRGELLKRYPNAVIYAHRACWQRNEAAPAERDAHPCSRSGPIDNTVERRFVPLDPGEQQTPPRTKVLTPLYEARVEPDIHFLGFDLTVAEAKGGTGQNPTDDPGWFFVIRERPGDPCFGADTDLPFPDEPEKVQVWSDISWPAVQPAPPGSFIELATAPTLLRVTRPGLADDEKSDQFEEDQNIAWNRANMTAAELAYILFQAPVLVGVHASEMLPK